MKKIPVTADQMRDMRADRAYDFMMLSRLGPNVEHVPILRKIDLERIMNWEPTYEPIVRTSTVHLEDLKRTWRT